MYQTRKRKYLPKNVSGIFPIQFILELLQKKKKKYKILSKHGKITQN